MGADQTMMLTAIVLLLLLLAAIAAADRNNASARRWRKLYQDECADFRQWKREHSWATILPPAPTPPLDLDT